MRRKTFHEDGILSVRPFNGESLKTKKITFATLRMNKQKSICRKESECPGICEDFTGTTFI